LVAAHNLSDLQIRATWKPLLGVAHGSILGLTRSTSRLVLGHLDIQEYIAKITVDHILLMLKAVVEMIMWALILNLN
jgi:hypothetical protein